MLHLSIRLTFQTESTSISDYSYHLLLYLQCVCCPSALYFVKAHPTTTQAPQAKGEPPLLVTSLPDGILGYLCQPGAAAWSRRHSRLAYLKKWLSCTVRPNKAQLLIAHLSPMVLSPYNIQHHCLLLLWYHYLYFCSTTFTDILSYSSIGCCLIISL